MDQLSSTESQIANWYRNQVIFITGSTGFMGKVLVEKLLRDCPDIEACYLLMRTKRGIEPEQRRDEYINHMVCFIKSFANIKSNDCYFYVHILLGFRSYSCRKSEAIG